eukprot:8180255-Karenia_brevis.AAC.1
MENIPICLGIHQMFQTFQPFCPLKKTFGGAPGSSSRFEQKPRTLRLIGADDLSDQRGSGRPPLGVNPPPPDPSKGPTDLEAELTQLASSLK